MNTISSRTKFQVEMTYDGRTFRKIDPTGSWTTYPVQPMTLEEATFVRDDHASRGTCSTFTLVDVEFEAAQNRYASKAKSTFLEACGYDDLSSEERRAATWIRSTALEVYRTAAKQFLTAYIRQCYCV